MEMRSVRASRIVAAKIIKMRNTNALPSGPTDAPAYCNQGCGGGKRLLKSLVLRAWECCNPRHPSTHLNEFAKIVKRREE